MFSKPLLFFLFLPVFAILLKIIVTFLEKNKNKNFVYLKKNSILTEAEKSFYIALKEAVSDNYLLFPQVSLLEILSVPKGLSQKDHYSFLNKIQAKRIDFLLCEKESARPLLAIELDDWSHSRPDRILRDNFLDQAFEGAGLPLLHTRTANQYNKEDLKNQIQKLLMI